MWVGGWVGGFWFSGGGGRAAIKMTAICLSDSREDLSSAALGFSRVSGVADPTGTCVLVVLQLKRLFAV